MPSFQAMRDSIMLLASLISPRVGVRLSSTDRIF
jgi:hypothetical protein